MAVQNKVQLITYPDSLGGNLSELYSFLDEYFEGVFFGIHILPPFPSTGDRGFAPSTYFEIDPVFGDWSDMQKIAQKYDVILDVMINHISRHSKQFLNFQKYGRTSKYADMFITLEKIWPDRNPPKADLEKIFLRRPEHCFEDVKIETTGQMERVWATFGKRDWTEQIDLDVKAEITRKFIMDILAFMHQKGIKMLRLDAIAFVTKKAGTNCFFVEPDIYDFLDWIHAVADQHQILLLPEVHAHYTLQKRLSEHGNWVYNFVLPSLILHTIINKESETLQAYLKTCPKNQFTMLDCHDGIPVHPDIEDVLSVSDASRVVEHCLINGANVSKIYSPQHRREGSFDVHQINCTYYSALDENDDAYIIARAIQFFTPGIPQVYYVGLLAGKNDREAVEESGEMRAINRHNYSWQEIENASRNQVVKRLVELINFRNTHPAFNCDFQVIKTDQNLLALLWEGEEARAMLTVDLLRMKAKIEYSDLEGIDRLYTP
ncbi:MAG: sucrose phosphorylase [Anaerolineaceae bacterium]|nr:sucrose phosphorylase [Anaerolineaceae bacterium]